MPRSEVGGPPAGIRFSGCTGCGVGTDGFDGTCCAPAGAAIATAATTAMLTMIGFINHPPCTDYTIPHLQAAVLEVSILVVATAIMRHGHGGATVRAAYGPKSARQRGKRRGDRR
jgi:hypothetical protein